MANPVIRHEICNRDGSDPRILTKARGRKAGLPLNGIPTALGALRLRDPLTDRIRNLGGELLKVYRDNQLLVCGPVVTSDTSADSKSGVVNYGAAGAWWRMGHRLLGQSIDGAGRGVGYTEGTPLVPVDKSLIARHLVENENTKGDTGIRIGVITNSGAGYVGPWYFKVVAEAYIELGSTLGGFDFEIVPTEPTADGLGIQIGTLNVKPVIGVDRSTGANAVIYEYGTGKRNMASWQEQGTLDGLANRPYSLPAGFPDSHDAGTAPLTRNTSTAASEAAHGIHEALLTEDLSVTEYRQQLANEHARVRQVRRRIITFTPTKTGKRSYPVGVPAPTGGLSYGDIIAARAVYAGRLIFDVATRVYNIDIDTADGGAETLNLTTVPS